MIKIKDEYGNVIPGILRDPVTHSISNVDQVKYQKYKADQLRLSNEKLEMNNIKNEISEIKSLLSVIIHRLNAKG
jgi:hypothetical protein